MVQVLRQLGFQGTKGSEVSFPCTKCGACCAKVQGHPWIELLPIREDGSCQHYNWKTKECMIYDERPDCCRMDIVCPPRCWENQEAYCDKIHQSLYGVPRERGEDCKHEVWKMRDAVLVLGCGNRREMGIQLAKPGETPPASLKFEDNFRDVWTIDIDPYAKPKVEWDLERFPWPVPNNYFDEVHATEVLEHLGQMGDYNFFFALWRQIWDTLKPGGVVCASTPWWESVWAWQDPGHRRVYSPQILLYLDQHQYEWQIGKTAMTDYRRIFPPPYSFITRWAEMTGGEEGKPADPKNAGFGFVLQKEVYAAS